MTNPGEGSKHEDFWRRTDELPINENPLFQGYRPYELYGPDRAYISLFFDNEDRDVMKAFGVGYTVKAVDTRL